MGVIWKRIPFSKNQANGTAEYYLDNGQLLQTITFCNGILNGTALRLWSPEKIAADECYCNGRLLNGRYFDSCGNLVAEIVDGEGFALALAKKVFMNCKNFMRAC